MVDAATKQKGEEEGGEDEGEIRTAVRRSQQLTKTSDFSK
jgi:hypothetical protein